MALYAGLAAEHVYGETIFSFEDDAEHGGRSDHEKAWDLMKEYVPIRGCSHAGNEAFWSALERLQRRALAFVRRHQEEIHAVAAALLMRKTLSGEEAQRLLSPT